ncbi:hypothetical protein TWF679_010170 [Orbilia oligospora]|uniref:Uncharacterized protein n=1 Tax=Orbilia oligospora TaxID=2813651 RepID=A0A8H8V102_ORBOL|nr:hypothetical protein TWF679_010170 [Orbilia oligospora]
MNSIFRPTLLGGKVHRPYGTVSLPSLGPCDFVAHLKGVLPVPSPIPSRDGPSPLAEHLSAALPSYPLPPTPQELSLAWWRSVRPEWKEDKSHGKQKNWAPLTAAMDRLVMVNCDLDIFYHHTYEKGVADDCGVINHTSTWGKPAMRVPTYRARLHLTQQTRYKIPSQTLLVDRSAVGEGLTAGDVLEGFAGLLKKRLSASQRKLLRDQQILETGRLRAGGGYGHNGTQRDLLKPCPKGLRGKNNLIVAFGGVERDGTVKLMGWWALVDKGSADPPPREEAKPLESRKRGRDDEEVGGGKKQRV